MKFDVFDGDNPGWNAAIDKINPIDSDINFLPAWYKSWQDYEQASSKCIVAEIEGVIFVYPFFIKPIDGYQLGKTYYDIQTAYGYGGVITNKWEIPEYIISKFNHEVNTWLLENDVIAEFIREHPLLNNCSRDADYVTVRKNIYVEIKEDYIIPNQKTRQNISKIKRNENISVIIDKDLELMDEFCRLYNKNAIRLNMSKYYFFPPNYFEGIKEYLKEYAMLIHIKYRDKIIHSNLFFHYGNKGTMHLAGSDHDYQHLRGMDLLYYSAIEQSRKSGLDILTIGGGTTNDPEDSLFRFKCKFSDYSTDVMVGKKIINPVVYDKVIMDWEKQYPDLVHKYSNFFLRYRQVE